MGYGTHIPLSRSARSLSVIPASRDLIQDLRSPSVRDASQTLRLEKEMDRLNLDLLPLSSFILPGGSAPSAYLHQARTVCRRAERICVALESEQTLNKNALIYLNRLSDFLFIAARWCNNQGQTDVLWVPGGNSN